MDIDKLIDIIVVIDLMKCKIVDIKKCRILYDGKVSAYGKTYSSSVQVAR